MPKKTSTVHRSYISHSNIYLPISICIVSRSGLSFPHSSTLHRPIQSPIQSTAQTVQSSLPITIQTNPYPNESLSDAAFHFEFYQSIHLHRILHGQLLRKGFDEAHDDHVSRLLFGQPPAHQVKELIFTHLRDGSFMF